MNIVFLSDSVSNIAASLGEWTLKDWLTLIIIPLLYHFDRRLERLSKSIETLSREVEKSAGDTKAIQTTLIGVDGRNGLRSRIRRLEKRAEYMVVAVARLSGLTPHSLEAGDEDDDA